MARLDSPGAPPNTLTLPACRRCAPSSTFRSVDLPDPLAPSRATNSPRATVRETSRQTTRPPTRTLAPSSSTAGPSRRGRPVAGTSRPYHKTESCSQLCADRPSALRSCSRSMPSTRTTFSRPAAPRTIETPRTPTRARFAIRRQSASLARPSTGGALTRTSSTPSRSATISVARARGWSRTDISQAAIPVHDPPFRRSPVARPAGRLARDGAPSAGAPSSSLASWSKAASRLVQGGFAAAIDDQNRRNHDYHDQQDPADDVADFVVDGPFRHFFFGFFRFQDHHRDVFGLKLSQERRLIVRRVFDEHVLAVLEQQVQGAHPLVERGFLDLAAGQLLFVGRHALVGVVNDRFGACRDRGGQQPGTAQAGEDEDDLAAVERSEGSDHRRYLSGIPAARAPSRTATPGSEPRRSLASLSHRLEPLDLGQHHLAHSHRLRRHLDRLVLAHELECLVQRQSAVGVQANEHIGGGRAHVGEVLLLDRVDIEILRAGVLADDHPLVDLLARTDEQSPPLLQGHQRVAHRLAGAVGHQRAARTCQQLARPGLPAIEDVVHDAGPAGLGEELGAEPDQA